VILDAHLESDRHQNLTTSRGSPLAHDYQVCSTSITADSHTDSLLCLCGCAQVLTNQGRNISNQTQHLAGCRWGEVLVSQLDKSAVFVVVCAWPRVCRRGKVHCSMPGVEYIAGVNDVVRRMNGLYTVAYSEFHGWTFALQRQRETTTVSTPWTKTFV